jgi:glycosyltransferase involved in cell wall biosynthesis
VRVIQTIAGTRLDHGGTSRSVPALCDALVDLGIDNYLVTARPADPSILCNYPADTSRVRIGKESKLSRQLGVGRQFRSALKKLVSNVQDVIVHDHAVWLATNHAVARFCNQNNIQRIVSPRGMLGQWAMGNGRWKKRLAWALYQRIDLANAVGFHATSEQEADEIRSLGFQQPVIVAPNGVDIPNQLPARQNLGFRQALFLSRLHPKKGLLQLVQAWKSSEMPAEWHLTIAGPDENGHQQETLNLIKHLGLTDRISFAGPLDDTSKWQAYVNSDLFVLPSFNENFGIVIAEAMAAGLPVITTTGTPWSILDSQNMGWWVEPHVDALSAALAKASVMTHESLAEMGRKASDYVRSTYSWNETAARLAEFYLSIINSRKT